MFRIITNLPIIHGTVSPDFEDVKVALAENFAKRDEVGLQL